METNELNSNTKALKRASKRIGKAIVRVFHANSANAEDKKKIVTRTAAYLALFLELNTAAIVQISVLKVG